VFIERSNGSNRHHNSRKVRETYHFSKNWDVHETVTCFALFSAYFYARYGLCRSTTKRCVGSNGTGDGGGVDGLCLAYCGVVKLSIRSTGIGHDQILALKIIPPISIHSSDSTVAAMTIGAESSLPLTSSMCSITP